VAECLLWFFWTHRNLRISLGVPATCNNAYMIPFRRHLADQSCLTSKLQDNPCPEFQFSCILNVLNLKMLYEKLPSSTSTRLINLLPGKPDDPLECELLVIDLESDHVQYPAISYVWGEPSDKKPIQCMNEILMIPASLHTCLKEMRMGLCWADAICINQSDHPEALRERAQQVGMMGTIFSKASHVLVQLGEEPEGFLELCYVTKDLFQHVPDSMHPRLWNSIESLEASAHQAITSQILDAFDDIVSRPWFQRVWTLQEFVLARKLMMCLGRWEVSYDAFQATCLMIEQFYPYLNCRRSLERDVSKDLAVLWRCRHARMFLNNWRDTYKQEASIPLTEFIELSLYSDTTDVRDRLYGGYGILDCDMMQKIPVDYGISSKILSKQLSSLLLSDGHLSFVLEHCSGLNDDVPSWCINLDGSRINRRGLNASTITLSRNCEFYSAASDSTQSSSPVLADSSMMAVSGCILETISSLTPPLPSTSVNAEPTRRWRDVVPLHNWIMNSLLWLGAIHGLPPGKQLLHLSPTHSSLTEAEENELWRTLIQDVVLVATPVREISTRPGDGRKIFTHVDWRFSHWAQPKLRRGLASEDEEIGPESSVWITQIQKAAGKRVGATFSKRLALLPNEAKIGDEICIFEGVNAPFLLRKSGEHYKIVGSCYLHGMMDGEALKRDDWKPKTILIE
jgi:hypothetical protein